MQANRKKEHQLARTLYAYRHALEVKWNGYSHLSYNRQERKQLIFAWGKPLRHNQSYQTCPFGLRSTEKGPHGAHQNLTFMIALMGSKMPVAI